MHTFVKRFLLTALILLSHQLLAADSQPHKTICLNMIVKDESAVITRCLSSTLPVIDYWVIVDTGSSDGTQQIIIDYMKEKGVPGELKERPWKNFAHNRNEALEFAKGKADYVFFIDADEFMTYDDDFKLPVLDKDYYYGVVSFGGTMYDRIKLVKNDSGFKYEGVLHEAIVPPYKTTYGRIEKMKNVVTTEGARSKDPEKFLKDAKTLENALKDDPNNARHQYYLAQSYRDAGKHELALENYEKRVKMGGWDQETYVAMLGAARMQEELDMPPEVVIQGYKRAFQFRPSRKEAIYHLANYYRRQGDFKLGYNISKIGMTIPPSKDALFVQAWIDDYGMELENSICSYWNNQFEESQKISLQILQKKDIPNDIRECVERNLGFANAKLIEQATEPKQPKVIKSLEPATAKN